MTRLFPVPVVLALTVFLALAGCTSSSTEPIAMPLFFEGEVISLGSSIHNFTVVSEGLLRFEVIRLQEKVAEGEPPSERELSIGLGVGRPANGACATRYSVLVREGDVAVLSLAGAEFCVRMFDSGTLLLDQVAEYELSVSPN